MKDYRIETLLASSPSEDNAGVAPVTGAIYQTSSFINNGKSEYSYSRCANPTRRALEDKMALLDGGAAAFAFSSGLAAVSACFSLLSQGDEVLMSADVYGGTYRLQEQIFKNFGINFVFADLSVPGEAEKHMT